MAVPCDEEKDGATELAPALDSAHDASTCCDTPGTAAALPHTNYLFASDATHGIGQSMQCKNRIVFVLSLCNRWIPLLYFSIVRDILARNVIF